jgi:hypothetical protein
MRTQLGLRWWLASHTLLITYHGLVGVFTLLLLAHLDLPLRLFMYLLECLQLPMRPGILIGGHGSLICGAPRSIGRSVGHGIRQFEYHRVDSCVVALQRDQGLLGLPPQVIDKDGGFSIHSLSTHCNGMPI